MADEPTTPPATPPPPPQPDPLAQLDSWAKSFGAKEKNEGKAAALRQVQEALGMTPEEAKAFIEAAKEKEREGMAEADRKLAEANEKEAKAQAALAQASQRELNAEIRAALIEAGIPRAQAATVAPMVQVELKDWDEAKVGEAVTKLKSDLPQLFSSSTEEEEEEEQGPPAGQPAGTDTTTRGTKPKGGGKPTSSKDRARARFLERYPEHART